MVIQGLRYCPAIACGHPTASHKMPPFENTAPRAEKRPSGMLQKLGWKPTWILTFPSEHPHNRDDAQRYVNLNSVGTKLDSCSYLGSLHQWRITTPPTKRHHFLNTPREEMRPVAWLLEKTRFLINSSWILSSSGRSLLPTIPKHSWILGRWGPVTCFRISQKLS